MKKPKIDAKQAVEDIRAGTDDTALMAKYNVSAKGLESLFAKLVKAGALDSAELDRRHRAFSGTVIISRDLEIVAEAEPETSPTAEPEPAQTVKSGQTRSPISARSVAVDVRSGLDDSALMAKYDLSSQGLDRLLRKLVSVRVLEQAELDARMPSFDQTVDLGDILLDMQFPRSAEGRRVSGAIDLPIAAIPSEATSQQETAVAGEQAKDGDRPPLASPLGREKSEQEEASAPDSEAKTVGSVTQEGQAGEGDDRFVVQTLWYEEPVVVYVLMFTVFPLGFYLLHRHPTLSVRTKTRAAGIWCLVLVIALIFKPGDSSVARAVVDDLNKSGNHCHGEISGIFELTLRIDWTSRTAAHNVKNVINRIMAERKRLSEDGVRYFEYPNHAGTYNVLDFKTGKQTAINDEALPWFKAEHTPMRK